MSRQEIEMHVQQENEAADRIVSHLRGKMSKLHGFMVMSDIVEAVSNLNSSQVKNALVKAKEKLSSLPQTPV